MADSHRKVSDLLGQVLALQGAELFDQIAERETTAEAKAKMRWVLPVLAEAVLGAARGVEDNRAAYKRTEKAEFLSHLAVKIFNKRAAVSDFGGEHYARESVRLAKVILDEAELLVLAEEQAAAELERNRQSSGYIPDKPAEEPS